MKITRLSLKVFSRRFSRLSLMACFLVISFTSLACESGSGNMDESADQSGTTPFVEVRDGNFFIGDDPYYFIGFNYWYGMNLGADLQDGDYERLVRELDHLQELGVDNLRVLAASEGPDDAGWRVVPSSQPEPGVYNEDVIRGLDVLLDEMAKRDMRAVLVLNNFFQWSGGMAQYVSWVTGEPYQFPFLGEYTWDEYQTFANRFYALPEARELFKDKVRHLLTRTNTVNGRAYTDDPTIMSWQLANEPREFGYVEEYVDWVKATSDLIKSHAPNQLVSLGGEGKLLRRHNMDTRFEQLAQSDALDYLTIHLWIENWSLYDPAGDPEGTFMHAIGKSMGYIADHVAIAEQVGKPVVLEEFGVSRDGLDHDPSAPVTYRDQYLEVIFEATHHLAQERSAFAGLNIWTWSGEGYPEVPGEYWEPGRTLTGDPPHEYQGWYGIYEQDESTLELIRTYNERINALFH
ncbi:hypothetical protein QA596_03745 [Balneolales bacterium ANBcel1]|nr:hypothetical protein [Balneolales bacterium ANBcel1]